LSKEELALFAGADLSLPDARQEVAKGR
jgi:hypothetical protein